MLIIKIMPVKKGKSRRSEAKSAPKINVSRMPQGMTPEEWQKALRRQAAEKGHFGIRKPITPGDAFLVSSSAGDRTYRVNYYGSASPLNRCECMDFKTSGLGTCKHIEAISLASGGKYARASYHGPRNTVVYVDYTDGRQIKLRPGETGRDEMERLARMLFLPDGTLRELNCDPAEFIRLAREIDPDFEWKADALNMVIEARDKARRKAIIAEKYNGSYFDGLLKTSLHPYQADGVRFAFAEGRTINADEMGLGKTVQAIATAELLKKEGLIGSVIIICPTSLKYQWLAEIRRFTDSSVLVIEGDLLKRREQLRNEDFFYKICSFHAMSNTIKSGTVPEADMIIYDELQRLKNKETQMGKQLRKLCSQYVMALSGTPLENKLDELYSVTQLVDQYLLGPYYKFNADTTLRDENDKIIGYKNLHEISRRLSHTLLRRRKADVKLQMPARTDKILFVPMTKEQREIHDDYKFNVGMLIQKWRRHRFLSEADRKRLLLYLSMMRMVCDSTYILDQKTRHDTKIEEIKAIIAGMMEEGEGKVVIFSQWERMLRILAEELSDAGTDFCFLHGAVPSVKRKDLIDRFATDPDCRIFLSTDAGATGLNLQSASLLINVDLPWNPAVLEQRIARIYRLGQNNPVQIINMVAADTIEERMLSTLNFKSNLAAGILDGGEDAVFAENSKFDKIVETVEGVINEDAPAPEPEQSAPEAKTEAPNQAADTPLADSTHAPQQPVSAHPTPKASTPATGDEIRDVVAGGIAALGKIADLLRNPDSARAVADALVKEGPETGAATLNIPVPDKATVVNIFTALSAILSK